MPAPSAASATYRTLFHKCLTSRTPIDRFESFTRQLFSRTPVSSQSIAAELVSPALGAIPDPLQHQYIRRLVETNFLSLGEVLIAVARSAPELFSARPGGGYASEEELHEARGREEVEAGILMMLAGVVRFQKLRNPESIWTAVAATGKWMEVGMEGGRSSVTKEAVAEVVIALGQNEGVMKVWTGLIGAPPSRDLRGPFTATLTHFTQMVSVESPLIAPRLEGMFQYQRSPEQQFLGKTDMLGLLTAGGMEAGNDMMGLVDATSRIWARSSGIVWIDSLLVGLPLTDEEAIISYLTSRYRDDTNFMVSEFVLAAFDTLATAMNPLHPATPSQTFLVRSFIINKVPHILTRIFLQQDIFNVLMTQVLYRIDPVVLTNTTGNLFGGSGDLSSLPQDIRQEFLFALALHGLVEEGAIQGILGELPMMTLPASGRYSSEDLIAQCQLDPDRVERLLEELEGLDGNAGAVALAVVEIIRGMCEKKETLSLRSICGSLTRKPSSIDVVMMFVKPAYFLEPLCVLLDTWRYEEDLGEYQPVYEDFGYILLLVLTTIHRYDLPLTAAMLGESSDSMDSFIPRLLTRGLVAQRIEDIESADTHAQLGGWIKEIFEAEGISDSLMAACRPQDFYMLVPTFFLQSVMAAHRGVLDIDTLKDGFAYLLEPFLMPSLVSALTWLGNHVWENSSAGSEDTLAIPLQIMQSLVMPPSALFGEKTHVHQTVLSITARHLERVVREVVRSMEHTAPQTAQIISMADAILGAVNPHLRFKRAKSASHQELETWVSSSGAHHLHGGGTTAGGLVPTFKATVGTLIAWAAANHLGGENGVGMGVGVGVGIKAASGSGAGAVGPPWYTHRLTQSVTHAFGSRVVVLTLLDVILGFQQQHAAAAAAGAGGASANNTANPNLPLLPTTNPLIVDLAIDFAAVLIASPTSCADSHPAAFMTSNNSADGSSASANGGAHGSAHNNNNNNRIPGMSSSPHPPRIPQTTTTTTAPLSLIDALRLEASRALASLTSTSSPETNSSPTTKPSSSRPATTTTNNNPKPTKPSSTTSTTTTTTTTTLGKSPLPPGPQSQNKVNPGSRTDLLTRLAKRVEALLAPYQCPAILPAGSLRAVVPTTSSAPAAAANPGDNGGASAMAGASSMPGGSSGDDMMLMGMGFGGMSGMGDGGFGGGGFGGGFGGGGFGGGFGGMGMGMGMGMEMGMDFGGVDVDVDVDGELDLLREFDDSGMDLG